MARRARHRDAIDRQVRHAGAAEDELVTEEYVTLREGRLVLPVRTDGKGFVHSVPFGQIKAVFRPATKHKLRFEYTPINYEQPAGTLRRNIVFSQHKNVASSIGPRSVRGTDRGYRIFHPHIQVEPWWFS